MILTWFAGKVAFFVVARLGLETQQLGAALGNIQQVLSTTWRLCLFRSIPHTVHFSVLASLLLISCVVTLVEILKRDASEM